MKTRKIKQNRDPLRRQSILDAALSTFTELGYTASTLSLICLRSGASVGSVYHFFSGKAEIALELVRIAVRGWSEAAGEAAGRPSDPKDAICASVRGLLLWAETNSALFKFMEEMRAKAGTSAEFSVFSDIFSEGQNKAAELYKRWIEDGYVKEMPWPVAYALMMGPAYQYLSRRPLDQKIPLKDIELLVANAWLSVRSDLKKAE
jgi:AcrR family transcriptional regulator